MRLRLTFNAGREGETDVLMTRTVEADYVILEGLGVGDKPAPSRGISCRSGVFPFRVFVAVREPGGPVLAYKTILTVEEIDD